MDIDKLIHKVPAWKNPETLKYEPLDGGYSNRIYRVSADGQEYAFRINGSRNRHLGLGYSDEAEVMTLAAEYGIAPEVLDCGIQTDFLVTRFLDGTTLSTQQMKNPSTVKRVISILKKVHALPYRGKRISTPFNLTRSYFQSTGDLCNSWKIKLSAHLEKLGSIEKEQKKNPDFLKHYCHNDMFSHNIMDCTDGSLKLLDWELFGLGDIWFDLATISFSCGFNTDEENTLLTAYFGKSNNRFKSTMKNMKYVCMLREIGWAVLHTELNRQLAVPGKDFLDFADEVFSRLENGTYRLI